METIQKEVAAVPMSWFDTFIEKLMAAKEFTPPIEPDYPPSSPLVDVKITLDEVATISRRGMLCFKDEKPLLRIDEAHLPLHIVGDIHGQFRDLRIILSRCGDPVNTSFLFLGDYVDRGIQGVESFLLVLALRIRYPDRVFMLRGNHEDCNTGTVYGFYDECRAKFGQDGEAVWTHFVSVFNWMPISAIVAGKIMCMHGGLSPHLTSLQQIENLPRPSIIPPYGLLCDLLWADPDNTYPGWSISPRKISYCFDDTITKKFCADMGIDLIVRAHQCTKDFKNGYKFYADNRLLSIFTAPNYSNARYRGCVLRVTQELNCTFVLFNATVAPPPGK